MVRTLCLMAAMSTATGIIAVAQVTDRATWVQTVVSDSAGSYSSRRWIRTTSGLIAEEREQPVTVFSKHEMPMALSLMLDVSLSLDETPAARAQRCSAHHRRIWKRRSRQRRRVRHRSAGYWTIYGEPPEDLLVARTARDRRGHAVRGAQHCDHDGLVQPTSQETSSPWIGQGGTALWDAVWCGVRELQRDRESIRKVMILVTDGWENSSRSDRDSAVRFAQSVGVLIYTIGFYGTDGVASGLDGLNSPLLRRLSLETGGPFRSRGYRSARAGLRARIGEELRAHYVLGFERQ